jgi:hypothetical protein
MTLAEFEAAYAARSGVTVEWLHSMERFGEPCDCEEPECEGFRMGHQWEDALVENELRKRQSLAAGGGEHVIALRWNRTPPGRGVCHPVQ